jgi:predicted protein tyrosine phosphatase
MIHVCSLARLHATVEETGALHVVTLLKDIDRVERPKSVAEANHLILGMDDIAAPMDGYISPAEEHVARLIEFAHRWGRARTARPTPLVVHCYAGISRSTAGAYVAACALNPRRDELAIARELRRASVTASNPASCRSPTPCSAAMAAWSPRSTPIGRGEMAYEANPFRLDLE